MDNFTPLVVGTQVFGGNNRVSQTQTINTYKAPYCTDAISIYLDNGYNLKYVIQNLTNSVINVTGGSIMISSQ